MWYVYGIVSPITDMVIYVGCTSQKVSSRVSQHGVDKTSAAYSCIQYLRSEGYQERFVILDSFRDHKEALLFEQKMILSIRGLCNREYRHIKERQMVAAMLDQHEIDAILNGRRLVIRRTYTDHDDVPPELLGKEIPDEEYYRMFPEEIEQ